jgi:hypothetical protein
MNHDRVGQRGRTAESLPSLPRRLGVAPAIDDEGPVWQRDQRAVPAVWVAVWSALRRLPGVVQGSSALAEPGTRAVLVPTVREPQPGTSFAEAGHPLEPAHLHGPCDTSLHVVLPRDRGAVVTAQGWGIPCPLAVHGTELILFAPRDETELAVVIALATESVQWALARNGVTASADPEVSTPF